MKIWPQPFVKAAIQTAPNAYTLGSPWIWKWKACAPNGFLPSVFHAGMNFGEEWFEIQNSKTPMAAEPLEQNKIQNIWHKEFERQLENIPLVVKLNQEYQKIYMDTSNEQLIFVKVYCFKIVPTFLFIYMYIYINI